MSDPKHFLQHIIDDPDNDAPRLAYADWLDAEGDADRADFIRLQCALEYPSADEAAHAAMRQREAELLGQYGYRWAEEFGNQISVWVYRRGFIERVETGLETAAENIQDLLKRAPIRHIRDIAQFCDFTGVVEALPSLQRLTGLEFWGLYAFDNQLLARILQAPELAKLNTLILHHDRNGNLASETVLVEALQSPLRANLRELAINVDGTWRGPSPRIAQAIARSPYLHNLRTLNLSNARLGVATVEAIGRSSGLAGLVTLDLGQCSLTEATWRAVLTLPQLANIRWLRLHDARIVDRQGGHIGYLAARPDYVEAFSAYECTIDWDSDSIDPYSGGTWTGLSWEGRRRNRLFAMSEFIRVQDYDALEASYRRECLIQSGLAIAPTIGELAFSDYQEALGVQLDEMLTRLEQMNAQALVLRIRPDLGWRGTLDAQRNPMPDSWEPFEEYSYSIPILQIAAPDFAAAAAIYVEHPWNGSVEPSRPALYLLARTIAAFGRCLQQRRVPVPVWFSCIWAAFRMM